jgi:hypothetical protein
MTYDCKLHRARVDEKIKNVTLGLIEDKLVTFSYVEKVKFIEDNREKIDVIVSDINAIYEHKIDKEFFKLDTQYCIFKPKSLNDWTDLKKALDRYFNFVEINNNKNRHQQETPVISAKNLIRLNEELRPRLISRAVEKIRWYIHEKIEKYLIKSIEITSCLNPVTSKCYTTSDALVILEQSEGLIEEIILKMIEEYITVDMFHRFFTDKNLDLDIDSFFRTKTNSKTDWISKIITNTIGEDVYPLTSRVLTKKRTVAHMLIQGRK